VSGKCAETPEVFLSKEKKRFWCKLSNDIPTRISSFSISQSPFLWLLKTSFFFLIDSFQTL